MVVCSFVEIMEEYRSAGGVIVIPDTPAVVAKRAVATVSNDVDNMATLKTAGGTWTALVLKQQ